MSVKSILSCVTPNNESMDEEIQTYSDDNPESSSIVKEAWKNQESSSVEKESRNSSPPKARKHYKEATSGYSSATGSGTLLEELTKHLPLKYGKARTVSPYELT